MFWERIPLVHFKESVMSTAKMVLVLLFLLVALGIVGRIDYEDAKRMERANIPMEYGFCACVSRLTLPVNAALRSLSEPLRFWSLSPRPPMSGCPHRRF